MTSDSDDALSWDGDDGVPSKAPAPKDSDRAVSAPRGEAPDDAALPDGWNAVGRGSEAVGRVDTDGTVTMPAEQGASHLSTAMLLTLGVVGGVYLLYSIGWVVGGLRLKPLANLIVDDAMYVPWFVLAVAAPALWFLTVWVLTRAKAAWIRIGLLLLGVVLLVPWPFVTVGGDRIMTEQQAVSPAPSGSPRWLSAVVLGLAGLFYAYAIWNAVAHLISMAQNGLTGIGWVTLLFGVVFPVIVFVFAYAIGRRRRAGELALVLLAGLGVVAVFWLSLIGYSILNMSDLVTAVA